MDWFLINSLEKRGYFRFVGIDNFLENFLRIFVARLDAFEIQDRKATEFAHRDRELHIDHSVHRAGEDRDFQFERPGIFARQTKTDVDFVWIDGDATRDR